MAKFNRTKGKIALIEKMEKRTGLDVYLDETGFCTVDQVDPVDDTATRVWTSRGQGEKAFGACLAWLRGYERELKRDRRKEAKRKKRRSFGRSQDNRPFAALNTVKVL